jgi:hypothetical protein
MMDMGKLCEHLLAIMKTDNDFLARMDAKMKAWREKADADMKAWGKKSAGCSLRQRIPERR